jgi:uncharacterized protein (TIGR02145 family)
MNYEKEVSKIVERVKSSERLLAKVEKKTPLKIIREMKYYLEKRKLNRENKELIQINPETMQAGIAPVGYYIEAGSRKFTSYAKRMFNDLVEVIKPYLKSFYNAVRDWPRFNVEGMDNYKTVSKADLAKITELKEGVENFQNKYRNELAKLRPEKKKKMYNYITGNLNQEKGDLNSVIKPDTQVTDIDGNKYTTIRIGTQVWMVENLKTTKLNDGTDISLESNEIAWSLLETPGYCWYNNSTETYKKTYGALYNWYAVETGKLCPEGWHVPTDSEWRTLIEYLGDEKIAGGKLKEASAKPEHWQIPNSGANNETGFTAVPGGYRDFDGTFYDIGYSGYWWSLMDNDSDSLLSISMSHEDSEINLYDNDPGDGLSVRCIRDF